MKHIFCILLFFVICAPAWAGKAITVGQLEDLLRSLKQDNKSDSEVANALKQVELSEELTRSAMNSVIRFVPGPLSTEQIYVLEARSADLIPPASDLPSTPAPDAVAQHAILARSAKYVANTYERLPELTASRTALRFQDNVDAVSSSSGISGSAKDVVAGSGFSQAASFVHFINSSNSAVHFNHGAQQAQPGKDKTAWGANKMIALEQPDPSLTAILHEAQDAAGIQWLRWELVNGKPAAVFSFTVPKKSSHLDLDICCFPSVKQAGVATFYTSMSAGALSGGSGTGGGGVAGNFQTNTDWHNFKTTVPYHGELFIDPDTGVVVRMITEAELKPTDVVHQVDTRIDYAPLKIGAQVLIVPIETIINTLVVPNGDSGAGTYTTRCTLFITEYKGYQQAGTK